MDILDQQTENIKNSIKDAKFFWLSSVLVFSGLVVNFLSTSDDYFSHILLIGYFSLALLVLMNIFIIDSIYSFIKENFYRFTTEELSEDELKRNIEMAQRRNLISDTLDFVIKIYSLLLIVGTLVYLFYAVC